MLLPRSLASKATLETSDREESLSIRREQTMPMHPELRELVRGTSMRTARQIVRLGNESMQRIKIQPFLASQRSCGKPGSIGAPLLANTGLSRSKPVWHRIFPEFL